MPKKKWFPIAFLIFALQLILELMILLKVIKLNVLPDKYLLFLIIVLMSALVGAALLLFAGAGKSPSRPRKVRRIFAVILAAIMGCVSFFGTTYLDKVDNMISSVTEQQTVSYSTIGVYVLKDSKAEEISDLAEDIFAVSKSTYATYMEEAIEKINTAVSGKITTRNFDSTDEAARALYEKKTDALIMNETFVNILKDTEDFSDFESKTRLIYEISVEATDSVAPSPSATADLQDEIQIKPFILYISGSDTRSKVLDVSRSDVNILMAVNPQTKQVLLLNTPRDYYVKNPAGGNSYDKLTHLGIYGVDCSMKGLGNLYGVDVDYYAQINFTGFETLIDAIGGITVDSDVAFSVGKYDFVVGPNEMDGAKALAFARDRHHQVSGDNARGKHQMMVIEAVIKKVTSGTTLLNNFSGIMDSLSGMFQTSLSTDIFTSLVKMQLEDMSSWDIRQYAVTGSGGSDYTYSMPNTKVYVMYQDEEKVSKASALLKKILNGEELSDSDF
ncbi:LCP family protein [Galactobacillus timonensis]|uniref:LCP family protein n=1 Tax=Galactobacillus timonensis TaxID=2041840 RepID=UPI000C85099C|nr:LCP family protein [Galactobacillus timonensis]